MADHINIAAPRKRYELEERLQREQMQTEIRVLQEAYDSLASDMDAIFTRIARGEQAELHYPDGQVIPITRARRRGDKDGGEA